MPCTKFCSDHCIRIEMRVKRNFQRIWIAMEKLLVKRGPVSSLRTRVIGVTSMFAACARDRRGDDPARPVAAGWSPTEYPKKYAHDFCFAVLCCGYTLTDFPISIRLTSLALWQSNDCPNASKATLMNLDKYFMWIHYERLHNHHKAKHNKTVCIFLGIYCRLPSGFRRQNQ